MRKITPAICYIYLILKEAHFMLLFQIPQRLPITLIFIKPIFLHHLQNDIEYFYIYTINSRSSIFFYKSGPQMINFGFISV